MQNSRAYTVNACFQDVPMTVLPPAPASPDAVTPAGGTRTSRATIDSVTTRVERKQITRAHLLAAALTLMGDGRGFGALSLREVTREAGVVPASFYRHFRDLEELGLALVEQGGATLRRLLREARRDGIPGADLLRGSVLIYKRFLEHNRPQFTFIAGERSGGSRAIRNAIRTEEGHFANEMAQDLRMLGQMKHLSMPALQLVCGLVVTTVLNAATEILDLPANQPRAEAELVDHVVRQLRVILLGARLWRDESRPVAPGQTSGAP